MLGDAAVPGNTEVGSPVMKSTNFVAMHFSRILMTWTLRYSPASHSNAYIVRKRKLNKNLLSITRLGEFHAFMFVSIKWLRENSV